MVATRTIGDLMSGEIERTLEISNQSIINAAVDMSDIQGTTTLTSRSVVNANVPPRPERVNVKAPNSEVAPKENETPARQVYSPISRPSSAEGLEGLAYMHPHAKVNPHNMPTFVPPAAGSPRQPQYSPRTTVLYSRSGNYNQNDQYTPLPRADIKPYHESYFNDVKPAVISLDADNRGNFVPEGLAASLQARVLNGQHIKEEVDTYDRRSFMQSPMMPPLPSPFPDQSIKTESVASDCQYKRESPVIQGPIRKPMKRPAGRTAEEVSRSSYSNDLSSETHSNTSTPLADELQEPHRQRRANEDGKCFLLFCMGILCILG